MGRKTKNRRKSFRKKRTKGRRRRRSRRVGGGDGGMMEVNIALSKARNKGHVDFDLFAHLMKAVIIAEKNKVNPDDLKDAKEYLETRLTDVGTSQEIYNEARNLVREEEMAHMASPQPPP